MNVLVNKNAPFLRGGGDKLKHFVVVSVVSVVVCCGDIDIDIDIDIIIDRTLLLIINSYIFFVFFFFSLCCCFCGKKICLFPQNRTRRNHYA